MTINLALYLSTYDVLYLKYQCFFQRLINYYDFNDIKRTIRESAYYCHRLNFSNFYKTFRKVIHFKVNNAKNAIFGNIIRKAFWYYCFSLLKFQEAYDWESDYKNSDGLGAKRGKQQKGRPQQQQPGQMQLLFTAICFGYSWNCATLHRIMLSY